MTPFVKNLLRRFLGRLLGEMYSAKWQGSNATVKTAQMQLFMHWRSLAASGQGLPSINDTGYRVFSGTDDDGRLLYLFAVLGFRTRKFVDVGAGNCINSNCTNLVLNFGFHGLFIDGNPRNVERGREFYSAHLDSCLYPPLFACEFINVENINQIIARHGIQGEIDLLSIDIDGNDYWVWKHRHPIVTQKQVKTIQFPRKSRISAPKPFGSI